MTDDGRDTGERGLLDALRAGDEAAFAGLVTANHGALLRLVGSFVSAPGAAEEVVQETWLAVIRGLDGFEGRSSLRTWIFRIAANLARTRGVREGRSIAFSSLERGGGGDDAAVAADRFLPGDDPSWPGHWDRPPADWGPDAGARLLRRELRGVIAEELGLLPPAQRLVMTLRDVEGWSSDEVCEALDVTPGNQRVLLHRARTRVRAALERYFDEEGV